MKPYLTKILIVLGLIMTSFIIFNLKDKPIDYAITSGNELSNIQFNQNSYVKKLNTIINEEEIIIPNQFVKQAENDSIALYLEESALAIAVKDKKNNYVWFSYDVTNPCISIPVYDKTICKDITDSNWRVLRSGLTVNMYNQSGPTTKTILDEEAPVLTYTKLDHGFKVTVDYQNKTMIKFDLYVTIEGDHLITEIPRDSINEYNPLLFKSGKDNVIDPNIFLKDIVIFPQFGATANKENGYFVVPDGSGAIITLPEKPKFLKNYTASVYGEDVGYKEAATFDNLALQIKPVKPLSRITLPIYGIIHDVGNQGLLVISENGANYADYNFVSKAGKQNRYYQTYFSYNYRKEFKQFQSRVDQGKSLINYQLNPNEFDLKQRYVFLSGSEADYVGVAKNYRQFLENQMILKENANLNKELSTKINIIGNEVEVGIFKEKNVTITKYEDVIAMVKQLKIDGYNQLEVTYKTFNLPDHAYRFEIFNQLGGKRDLQEMIDYLNEQNVDFDYFVDYVNSYSYKQNKYTASMLSRKSMSVLNMSYVYAFSYLNHPKHMSSMIKDDLKAYQKNEIERIALGGLSEAVFTSTEKGIVHSSSENMTYILDSLNSLRSNNITVNLFNPDAYLYGYVTNYYDAPLTSSELMFVDATIPLVQLVTSGYMNLYSPNLNFVSNEVDTRLRLVEYGIQPSYLLTHEDVYDLKYTNSSNIYISQYDVLQHRMKTNHDFIKPGLDRIAGIEMINHTFLDEGVSLVEYANGIKLVINYTNTDYHYNEKTIKAKEYEIV